MNRAHLLIGKLRNQEGSFAEKINSLDGSEKREEITSLVRPYELQGERYGVFMQVKSICQFLSEMTDQKRLIVDNSYSKIMQRRIRSDLISRDYHCPCGKAYLSYPALHTHIKKYHEDPETTLQQAVIPRKEKLKRGRPTQTKNTPVSSEFEELTFIETSILKIYEELCKSTKEAIMLQDNEENSLQALQHEYQQRLRQEAANELELLTLEEADDYEMMVSSLSSKLTKHFTMEVSVRVKVMMAVGFIQHQVEGARREECVSKMAAFGWGPKHRVVAQVLFDVLMRALQQSSRTQFILSSNDS